jgi:hypothetical protein
MHMPAFLLAHGTTCGRQQLEVVNSKDLFCITADLLCVAAAGWESIGTTSCWSASPTWMQGGEGHMSTCRNSSWSAGFTARKYVRMA